MIFRNRNKEKNISRHSLFKQKQISKFRSRQNIKHRNIDNVKILPAYITLIYIYILLYNVTSKSCLLKIARKVYRLDKFRCPPKNSWRDPLATSVGGSCTDVRAAARFTRKRRPGNARFDRCTF